MLAVLQEDILGVRVIRAGAASLDVSVPATSVARASGVVATQRGPVPIIMDTRPAGHETIDVTVPANTTALIHIAAHDAHNLNDAGRSVTKDPGVGPILARNGEIQLSVGAGHYVLTNAAPSVKARDGSSSTPWIAVLIALAAVAIGALVMMWKGVRHRLRCD